MYPAEVCTVFELGDLNSMREQRNIFRALLPFSVYISFNGVRGVGIRDLNGTVQGYERHFLVSTEIVSFSVVSCFTGIVSRSFLPYRLWSLRDAIKCIVCNGAVEMQKVGWLWEKESGGR